MDHVLPFTPQQEQQAMMNILSDMLSDRGQLEKQRLAVFNILEDIDTSQKNLKKSHLQLQIIQDLTQKLSASLELSSVTKSIVEAVWKLFPTVVVSYVISSLKEGGPSNEINVYSPGPVGEPFLQNVADSIKIGLTSIPGQTMPSQTFTFTIIEGEKRPCLELLPSSQANVPIIIPGMVVGLFNLSSSRSGLFGKTELNLIHTIIGSASQSIERLRLLIKSEHSRLNDLVASMSNGVLMFDREHRVIVNNPTLVKMIDGGDGEISLDAFLQKVRIAPQIEDMMAKNQPIKIDQLVLDDHTFEITVAPVRDSKGELSAGAIILHDITHMMEVDRMKTEFVSLASHQLRTPLTSINWYIEMLQAGDAGDLNDKQKEFISEVYKGSKRMVQLVNDLLSVSRLETGRLKIEPVPTDLNAFIGEVRKEVEPLVHDAGCQVSLELPEKKVAQVNVDKILLRQVIVNLLTNAIRYSSVGEKGQVTVSLIASPKEYTIKVQDNGIGIPKEVQGRIFEKFYRADNARTVVADGNGLGLYLAKQIMESSGGTIGFDSSGKGTTFYATIPVSGMKSKEGEKGLER